MSDSDYIVFVDESGDHSLDSINPDWPVFVLCFCIFPVAAYVEVVTPTIKRLKFDTFGHDLVVLHEHDIRKKRGAFSLLNQQARESFMERLTEVIANTDVTIVAVVIDKVKHKARYDEPYHPYHLAMQFGLERIRHFLKIKQQLDRETCIVFEARGAKEDQALELAFRRVCAGANRYSQSLPLRILVADKKTNSEGLQLADLTARPIGLHVNASRTGEPSLGCAADQVLQGGLQLHQRQRLESIPLKSRRAPGKSQEPSAGREVPTHFSSPPALAGFPSIPSGTWAFAHRRAEINASALAWLMH